jgi:nicotinamidase-related amidase
MTRTIDLQRNGPAFLQYLEAWYRDLPDVALSSLIGAAPERVALWSIDMINGFCSSGPLAGPRVNALIPDIATLFLRAHALGLRNFVLTQDTHSAETPEFAAFPPHCVAGTAESTTVPELAGLPFFDQISVIRKNSLSSHINTDAAAWHTAHPQVETYILVGNCTDLCVYTAAMQLRLEANALNLTRRVIVVAGAVNTFDTPLETAAQLGIYAHDGDLHHVLFLHHMAQNGIEVVGTLR